MTATHEEKLRQQFSIRVKTFNTAANWMLDPELLAAHVRSLQGGAPMPGHCLDLCCGTGIVGRELLKQGWKVTGIDITPEMAQEANRSFEAVAGSVEQMPFRDASFDAAILRQSYMLLNGPRALAEIRRVLKPRGVFVLSQAASFGSNDDRTYQAVQEARHINMKRYYRTEDLVAELEENGFTVESIEDLRVRESVDQWLGRAPELPAELRARIRRLIAEAPEGYKAAHRVEFQGSELFEDWNWLVIQARVKS